MRFSRKLSAALLAAACSITVALSGCGNASDPASTAAPSLNSTESVSESVRASSPASAASTTAAAGSTVPASTAAPTTPVDAATAAVPSVNPPFTDPVTSLSNEAISWGYATNDRDETNRPNGCLYYQRLYGSYADFIGPKNNMIYLTMDEGYEAGYTPTILDTLKEKNVKATFFLTKQFFDSDPDLIQRMIDEGHTIGNHTCAHPAGGIQQLGVDGQTEDIMNLHNLIKDKFNYDMTLFRYPEGVFSQQSLAVLNDLGYRPIFWSFAHNDWNVDNQPDPTDSLQKCLDQIHPGAVYLLHAVSATNTEILGEFIDGARAKGYEFATVPSAGFAN